MSSPHPFDSSDPRTYWFEDFEVGQVFDVGAVTMHESEMIEFAERYDPQPFHIDPVAAEAGAYGGIIASGWLTASLMMRLLTDGFVGPSSLGAAGIDDLRWSAPIRAGARLSLRVTVLDKRESRSYPDRGFMRTRNETIDEHGDVVMSMVPSMMVGRRN